jgi:hypothetical protein
MTDGDSILDAAAIAQWARDSGIHLLTSRWAWPSAEILHFSGLCLLFGTVGMFDLRMLGVARGVPTHTLHRLVPIGVAGFALCVATGFLFVVSAPDQYLYNPALQIKLALIALAGTNVAMFYATAARTVAATGDDDLPPFRTRVHAAISLACWLGVIMCGRVITVFRPPWYWCAWC